MQSSHKLNKEYQMLVSSVREFAHKELLPRLADNDHYPASDYFNTALDKALALDFFHVMLPEDSNGWGGKIMPLGLILKHISEVDASLGCILLTHAITQELFHAAGETDMLKPLTRETMAQGEFLTAYPLFSNPDDDDIQLTATPQNGDFMITGQGEYVVLAPMARYAILPAKTAQDVGYDFFSVDLAQSGVKRSGPVLGMGLHACPVEDLIFNHAKGCLIGQPGQGPSYFARTMTRMLPAAAAVSCGLMQGSLKEALQYSRKRKQGGRRILDWSELRLIIADMALKARTADILLDRALCAVDDHAADWDQDAYAAAIYILETACDLASDGIQALGGYGYTKHHFQERRFRDSQHMRSVFGSSSPRRLRFVRECLKW